MVYRSGVEYVTLPLRRYTHTKRKNLRDREQFPGRDASPIRVRRPMRVYVVARVSSSCGLGRARERASHVHNPPVYLASTSGRTTRCLRVDLERQPEDFAM